MNDDDEVPPAHKALMEALIDQLYTSQVDLASQASALAIAVAYLMDQHHGHYECQQRIGTCIMHALDGDYSRYNPANQMLNGYIMPIDSDTKH